MIEGMEPGSNCLDQVKQAKDIEEVKQARKEIDLEGGCHLVAYCIVQKLRQTTNLATIDITIILC